jgi:hypothetical protein
MRHSFNDIVDRSERLVAMQLLAEKRFAELDDPDAWAEFADGLARFPRLSPANVFLVLDQYPGATWLASHRTWASVQRTPVERGIAVLAPSMRQKRVNGRAVWDGGRPVVEEVRHRPATVFDYTSTAGHILERPWSQPSPTPPEGLIDDLRAAAAAIGYAVESRLAEAPAERRVFALIHGQSDADKAQRLAHDLGAAAGGIAGAELFAYALCTANGFEVPRPAKPVDPRAAARSARSGLQRVLQRTSFRNMA